MKVFILQDAYLKLDNYTVKIDENYISSKFTFNRSDGNGIVVNGENILKVDAQKLQHRIILSTPESKDDKEYSHILMTTTIDLCKIATVQTNMLVRAFMQSYLRTSKNHFICPHPKNIPFKVTNLTLTDQLFPPMLTETKFKLNLTLYATIKDKKGWIFMYSRQVFISYKK